MPEISWWVGQVFDGIGSGGLVVIFNKTARDIYTAGLATVPSIHKNTTWLSALTDECFLTVCAVGQ